MILNFWILFLCSYAYCKTSSIPQNTLSTLFSHFLENRKEKLPPNSLYSFKTYFNDQQIPLVRGKDSSLISTISNFLEEHALETKA